MPGACILISRCVSLAFVFLYFQWHAAELFEELFPTAFGLLPSLSFFFFPLHGSHNQDSEHLWSLIGGHTFQAVDCADTMARRGGAAGICLGGCFTEDVFPLGLDLKGSNWAHDCQKAEGPLCSWWKSLLGDLPEWGQGWVLSSFLPALIISLNRGKTSSFMTRLCLMERF